MGLLGESTPLAFALSFYVMFSGVFMYNINQVQPTPYLDEVFHIPQTQKYCNGSFNEWDPKITTLPGSYLIAAGILVPLGKIGVLNWNPCTTLNLRAFNLGVGMLNLVVINAILGYYMPNTTNGKKVLAALNIAMFPVLYFFNFLFYTDVTSTFFLLTMHLQYLKRNFSYSSLLGGAAVFVRQTNIIWVAGNIIMMVWDMLFKIFWKFGIQANKLLGDEKNKRLAKLLEQKYLQPEHKKPHQFRQFMLYSGYNLKASNLLLNIIKEELTRTGVIMKCFGYVSVLLLFTLFVFWNGGIVVGDKKAHKMVINLPQIGYFTLVYGLSCSPFLFKRINSTRRLMLKKNGLVLFLISCSLLAVLFNTVAHPYLLADNRHYPFYVWKRVYATGILKFLLVPFYITACFFIVHNSNAKPSYMGGFWICCIAQLVPQLLLEFRYFIPAYIFARITMRDVAWWELVLEVVMFTALNLFTLYMFTLKPFKWPGVDELQRFMW